MGLMESLAMNPRLKNLIFEPIPEPDAKPPLVAEFLKESELAPDISLSNISLMTIMGPQLSLHRCYGFYMRSISNGLLGLKWLLIPAN